MRDACSTSTASAGCHTEPVTHSRSDVHRLLEAHRLQPSRALGQNFVADANTVRRVVRLAGVGAGDRVVEIGAGLGSLTVALAEVGASVTAVEIDRHLVPVLREEVEPAGVRVVEADALCADWDELADPADGPWSLVSNLPYNVAVPLVVRVLETAPQVTMLLVMVQREVGERLAAGPGSRAYGAVSVKVAYWADAPTGREGVPRGVRAPSSGRVGARPDRAPVPAGCPPGDGLDVEAGNEVDDGAAPTAASRAHRWPWARERRPTSGSSPSSGPASARDARCCAGRSRGWSTRLPFAAAGVDPTTRAEQVVARTVVPAGGMAGAGPSQPMTATGAGDGNGDRVERKAAGSSSSRRRPS